MARIELNLDLNRVEGDLEIRLTVEEGVVVEARTVGTMYRGLEQILIGRAARDALVITPRVCGICSTSHLYAAVLALEQAWGLHPPANATRVRNLCLGAEGLQSDLRHSFLFFAPDFCQPCYAQQPEYARIMAEFEPFQGRIYLETLAATRRIVRIVAEFGGQWPHSSFMVPGGVTMGPDIRRLLACGAELDATRRWLEQSVLGGDMEAWLALPDAQAFHAWLEQAGPADAALALMNRFARGLQLHQRGAGSGHMLSYGAGYDPEAMARGERITRMAGGFLNGDTGEIQALDQSLINEHVRHSWYQPYDGGRHPWQGETVPDYRPDSDRYSWSKAPRYGERVVQTGPLAELLLGGDALMKSLYREEGGSAWLRQLARLRRVAHSLLQGRAMLDEMALHLDEPHFEVSATSAASIDPDGDGYGLVMAARGALGHWIKVREGVIEKYQIVTPTAWNASPRDSQGQPGHWEQSLVGLKVGEGEDTTEIGHIIRSHDPCLVCTVHMMSSDQRLRFSPF